MRTPSITSNQMDDWDPKEVCRSGLEAAALIIRLRESRLRASALDRRMEVKIFMRADGAERRSARRIRGLLHGIARQTASVISAGRKGADRQSRLVAARVAAPTLMA
jgi:hypothetical protein